MRIEKYFNANKKDIEDKKFNILIGISLGNRYFTPDHVREFLNWANKFTKEKILVVIPDKIHAINYQVKRDFSPSRAMKVAIRKGGDIENMVRALIAELEIPDNNISVAHWEEIEDAVYSHQLAQFQNAFKEDPIFHEKILSIVREVPHFQTPEFNESHYERLCQYVIDELPLLTSGVRLNGVNYELLPYPGLANIDYLAFDIQDGRAFPALTKKLGLKTKLKIIEAYAN